MNDSQTEKNPPLRSIRVTVGSGIIVTGILFTAISLIALLGFYSFQKVLEDFSKRTFPLSIQEAQNSILLSQLLQEADLLQNADSQQKRRIAFDNVNEQLSRISVLNSSHYHSLTLTQDSRLDFLTQSINTLNNLISERITARNDFHAASSGLFTQSQQIHTTAGTLLAANPPPQTREIIKIFEEQAFTLLRKSLSPKVQPSLFELKEKARKVDSLIQEMQKTLLSLPDDLQVPAQLLVQTLTDVLLGEDGMISLEKRYLSIKNDCANRMTLIRNELENKGDSSMSYFFDLTTSVADEASLLSEKVHRQIQVLSVLFIISLLLAIGFFFYFRRFLIKRLTNLNATVLAMVGGENLQIEEQGSDEITAIAHSINYFSTALHQAKSVAEKSAGQKSEFLAHMSHEIRTPLNAVLGFSDLALKTKNPTEHIDYLRKINNASHSLLDIINSILDISKMEAGKFTFDKVEFDLRALLEDLSSIISLKCEESGLHFYYNIEPGTPYKLVGDPLRLNQILINLVTNAFKFTEEGSITIHIAAKDRLSNWKTKTTLLISVQDTGDGISAEQSRHLFEPFTQADTSITRKAGGTGLGLAICKNLVEMMGGNIWLGQNEPKGSIFSFTCTFELVGHSCFYQAPEILTGMPAIVMSRVPQSATELSMQLGHFGFTIMQTLSIDEILASIQQKNEQPDKHLQEIIFIDCENLSFQWQEAIGSIKKTMTERSTSPIILIGPQRLAAHFHSQHKDDSDYFLTTPITPAKLLDAVTTVVDIDNPYCLQKTSLFPEKNMAGGRMHGGATILLVEDNEINSQIATAYLKSRNFAVIVAQNGAEALEILFGSGGARINAILMDIQMPVMDGYTASKAIRECNSHLADIPIVALTAHAMPEEREKCLASGMNGYITKPINAEALFDILEKLIGRQIDKQLKTNQTENNSTIPEDLLAKNSSLNMKTGLAQVMNDPALYMDLLMSFVKKYRSWPESIRTAFDKGDVAEGRHLIHSLKGVSGNLGMEKLFSLTVRLELHLRDNETDSIQQLLREVQEETGVVCDFLSDWLKQHRNSQWHSQDAQSTINGYTYNLEDVTEALYASLKNNSSKALKQIQLLRSQLGDEDSYIFSKIEQHAKDLDFDKARELLTEWQNQE